VGTDISYEHLAFILMGRASFETSWSTQRHSVDLKPESQLTICIREGSISNLSWLRSSVFILVRTSSGVVCYVTGANLMDGDNVRVRGGVEGERLNR
jgi:hypothetical protein